MLTRSGKQPLDELLSNSPVLGEGASGKVYKISPAKARLIQKMLASRASFIANLDRNGSYALKVARYIAPSEIEIMRKLQKCAPGLSPKLYLASETSSGSSGSDVIIMEHIVGKTLYDFQKETGTRVPSQIVIKALMKLKACGVRHNDLHGANLIVMTKRGRIAGVKLIDFGEASETRAIHPKQYNPTLNSNYRYMYPTGH